MNDHHQNPESQVWQRVFQPPEQPTSDLRPLRMAVMELAAGYRHLSQTLTGPGKELARRLWEEEQASAACLKGLALLSGGGPEVLKIWDPPKESPQKLLVKCYHKSRRCMVECMTRSAEAEYGTVFRHLADREGQHCALLSQLLGML